MAAKKKSAAGPTAPIEVAAPKNKEAIERDKKTLARIEKLAMETVRAVEKGVNPAFDIRMRALSNVNFNQKKRIIELGDKTQSREFFNTSMAKKFMQSFLIANGCKQLIDENKTISIRQMFYLTKHTLPGSSENTFDTQDESDPIIEDLEVTVDALREELHLFAQKKGSLVGDMTIVDRGDVIDLSRMGSGGWSIPSICEPHAIEFRKCEAEFILYVEKAAIWNRLNEDRFWKQHKCIVMDAGGQPTRGARRLLQRMATELKLPIYVLVDNDPWGLYIYSVLKQGSISLAFESMRLAVPNVRFLGMASADYKKFNLPPSVEIKLDPKDVTRANQMKAYEWFKDQKWQKEIDAQLKNGFKMELDGLLTKGISFISEEYIPKKIRDKDFLT